jgi:Fe-S-cluster containining protein
MDRSSRFFYCCNACGRCCRDKVIALSPYDVIRLAGAAGITAAIAVDRYTIRRGSLLKFAANGECVALQGVQCSVHRGRPLACRLYPLGLERAGSGAERFVRLDPASGSAGIYGENGTVQAFLDNQGVDEYLAVNSRYRALVLLMRARIETLVDFEVVEPREFWRCATREALAESDFDQNPLIDALFDPERLGCLRDSSAATVEAHLDALAQQILAASDPAPIAAAGVLLAVSLGYSPAEAIGFR